MEQRYDQVGRTSQKSRTRAALVSAVRRLMAGGAMPSVEQVAAAAQVSRTTAYRYFPTQQAMVLAAHPETAAASLLGTDAPQDPSERFELVLTEHLRILREWEPQLRASLRLSLEPGAAQPPLRGGRVIGWLVDALTPLAATRPDLDLRDIAVRVRSAAGIESYVWLRDVAGLAADEAVEVLRSNARAVLADRLRDRDRESRATRPPDA